MVQLFDSSSAQLGARWHEGCCICHYLSWNDAIKPRLLFSSFGCCISKGSFFTDNWCKASNSPEMMNKHISEKTHTWHINETKKKQHFLSFYKQYPATALYCIIISCQSSSFWSWKIISYIAYQSCKCHAKIASDCRRFSAVSILDARIFHLLSLDAVGNRYK